MKRICMVWLCALLMLSSAFVGMNFENEVGGINITDEPRASYVITNVWELQNMSLDLAGNYTLANDIDASITSGWNGGAGFEPIANDTDPGTNGFQGTTFTGSLDGQGYSITGLFINRSSEDYIGLFGYVDSVGAVSNVSLINNSVSGYRYVGGFAGETDGDITNCYSTGNASGTFFGVGGFACSNGGTITNCSSTGDASGTGNYVGGFVFFNGGTIANCSSTGDASGGGTVGGFAGDNNGGTITNCYSTGNASGSVQVGGFAGYNNDGTISNCYSTGNASGADFVGGFAGCNGDGITNCSSTGNASGTGNYVGGFAGYTYGDIKNCYSTGNAIGDWRVGGFTGYNYQWGTITNCYSIGNVTGSTTVGGFAGENIDNGAITNCYSTGNVTGNTDIGGFAGNNTAIITDCFWDTDTSGWATSAGGTGKTTAEMKTKSTFTDAGWDFFNIWRIDEGITYPYFRVPSSTTLIARWPFNEGSGQYTNDTSGNDNDGTLMPSYPGNVPAWVDGISGNALDFDGNDDYVDIPPVMPINYDTDLTISTWINVEEGTGNHWVIRMGDKGVGGAFMTGIRVWDDDVIFCCAEEMVIWEDTPGFALNDNMWYNVVGVYQNRDMGLYVNGVFHDNATFTRTTTTSSTVHGTIGRSNPVASDAFNGTIDEVSIWSRALNETEIKEHYHSFLGLADTPWPMFRQNLNHTGLSPYDTSHVDGTEKWNFTTGSSVKFSPAIGNDGTIYVGSEDSNLYAINPDGVEKWHFTTGGGVWSSPAIGADGTIYVGSDDNNLYAINPNGIEKWNFTTGNHVASSPAIGNEGTIYVGSLDNNLYAIYPNGTEKWNFTTGHFVRSSPAIGNEGTIYVGSLDNNLYAIYPNGTKKWHFTTGFWMYSSPAIGNDGTIYVGSCDNNLYAINPNGTEKWRFPTGDLIWSSPAIGADGTIYVGSCDNSLYAINPNGTEKWRFPTGDLIWSSPAIGNEGTIYVGSLDNNLYAIYPNGTEKWHFTTGFWMYSSPAIGNDGTIYVGSDDNNLYAIGSSLCARWPFNEGWGQYTNDTSGNDNDGELMPSYPGNVPNWVNGVSGNALDFDGTDDYVEVPDDDALDITDEITIEAWVKLSSHVTWERVLSKANNAVDNCIYILGVSEYDGIYFALWNGGVQTYINGQADIPLNEWTHIVGVWNGSVMKAYLNGVEQPETQPFNGPIDTSTGPLRIGKGDNIHQHPFNGIIDEASIWGRALDATEILQHYQQYHKTHTVNLSLGWNLISLPLIQSDESITSVLSNISGKWDYIQAYNATDPDHWKTNATFKPDQLNELESLDHKTGFWINITESGVMLTVNGTMPSSTSIPLYAGWNLVGYPSLSEKSIADALAGTGYDRPVEGFNATAPYRLSQLADTYMMKPSEGYWVHVPADTMWTVDW